jgi:hypothetical protein
LSSASHIALVGSRQDVLNATGEHRGQVQPGVPDLFTAHGKFRTRGGQFRLQKSIGDRYLGVVGDFLRIVEFVPMPPSRAFWKGYLKLSLVSCPIALFPASSSSERVSFRQINKKTGHRLKQPYTCRCMYVSFGPDSIKRVGVFFFRCHENASVGMQFFIGGGSGSVTPTGAQRLSNLPPKRARLRIKAGINFALGTEPPHEGTLSMEDAAYLRLRAERYFRLARAKSDRRMADNLEALGREFLARAENLRSDLPSRQPPDAASLSGNIPPAASTS